jgi:pimeloyl-ACP methyl ester carboxylesterase
MFIDSLEAVQLGDTTQWIRVRGEDPSNPVLLIIQQGPGLPMINEVRRFEATLGLEKEFTVVYWDQRGCGRSLRDRNGRDALSLQLMADDTVALLELLQERFATKPFIAGFSMGATIGAYACARRPDLATVLVAVGTDVDGIAAGVSAYDFSLDTARQHSKKRAIRQLEKIGPPPHLTVKQFGTRVRWASNFRGVTVDQSYGAVVRGLITSLVRSSDYSFGDVLRTIRGIAVTQAGLLHEINELCLETSVPRIDLPIVMVQGRLDKVAPGDAALRYFDSLASPNKQFVWFERSAHTPQFDEPTRFRNLLCSIRDARLPSATSRSHIKTSADISLSPQRFNTEKSVQSDNGGSR